MVVKRKATITPPMIQTPRNIKLSLYGAGPRPCLDGSHNWLGCASNVDGPQMCVFMPGKSCTFARPTSRTRSVRLDDEPLQQVSAAEDRQSLRSQTNWSHRF